jgi:hypothetical protein
MAKSNGGAQREKVGKWVDRELRPMMSGKALTAPLEILTVPEMLDAYCILDHLEKAIAARKKAFRDPLLAYAEANGEELPKGGSKAVLEGTTVERQKRQTKEPEREKMLALVQKRDMDPTEVYDEIKQLVYNPSKTNHLVETGKLSGEEVDALCPISFALKVTKSADMKTLLKGASEAKVTKKKTTRRQANR